MSTTCNYIALISYCEHSGSFRTRSAGQRELFTKLFFACCFFSMQEPTKYQVGCGERLSRRIQSEPELSRTEIASDKPVIGSNPETAPRTDSKRIASESPTIRCTITNL
jgi:hypothetical protein